MRAESYKGGEEMGATEAEKSRKKDEYSVKVNLSGQVEEWSTSAYGENEAVRNAKFGLMKKYPDLRGVINAAFEDKRKFKVEKKEGSHNEIKVILGGKKDENKEMEKDNKGEDLQDQPELF